VVRGQGQGLQARGQGQGLVVRGQRQGQDLRLEDKDKEKDLWFEDKVKDSTCKLRTFLEDNTDMNYHCQCTACKVLWLSFSCTTKMCMVNQTPANIAIFDANYASVSTTTQDFPTKVKVQLLLVVYLNNNGKLTV